MTNVTNLRAYKAIKNPMLAICQRIEFHEKAIDMLFKTSIKTKQKQSEMLGMIRFLFWSNVVSWLTIICVIFALFSHSHSLANLI